jgi:hypothetical protein
MFYNVVQLRTALVVTPFGVALYSRPAWPPLPVPPLLARWLAVLKNDKRAIFTAAAQCSNLNRIG